MLTSQEEQEERRRVALQDADLRRQQQQGATFFQHGVSQAAELSGGRFGALGTPTVTGATPIPNYSAAGVHQGDPVGTEPPLGFSVNNLESSAAPPCSSSVEATGDPVDAPSSDDGGSATPSGGLVSERAGSSSSNKRSE